MTPWWVEHEVAIKASFIILAVILAAVVNWHTQKDVRRLHAWLDERERRCMRERAHRETELASVRGDGYGAPAGRRTAPLGSAPRGRQ